MPGPLTRWDPFSELGELRNRLDRLFDDWTDGRDRAWAPALDVVREEGRLVVYADLPGVTPEDVKIEVQDDMLTISGEHAGASEQQGKNHVRRERRHGSFYRSMSLPAGVDPDRIQATTKNGVLEVIVPIPDASKKAAVTITPTVG
ncbi:MAG: Hsp20/alpha crystallin family protein [Solirubrobacteraceae bacterium]